MKLKRIMTVAMAIMACLFSSCEENTDFHSLNENGGINEISISEYEKVTREYLSTIPDQNLTKAPSNWKDIVACDAAGAIIGAVAGLEGGVVGSSIGGVALGALSSLEVWRPGTIETVVDVAKEVASFVVDVVGDLWGSIFGSNNNDGKQNIPSDSTNTSDILDYDLMGGMLHYEITTEILQAHPDLNYDIIDVLNQVCINRDKNFKPIEADGAEKIRELVDYVVSEEFMLNYEENLHNLFIENVDSIDVQLNADFVFKVIELYNEAFRATSDIESFYNYSITMENMLHDYYVQNNKSELVHRTMIWMSVQRRGAGYWNKVNEYVK